MRDIYVIMGAAVWPGGLPSRAMRRRVESAIVAARSSSTALFLPSGGIGDNPPAEGVVMRSLLLERGISEDRVIIESRSRSTLASIINSADIIKRIDDIGRVFVCTDTYHQPRCRWLFSLMGIKAEYSSIPSGRPSVGLFRWIYFYCREAIAIPFDSAYCFLFRYANVPVAGVS